MAITFKGAAINTIGNLPTVGNKAPDFTLVKTDLSNLQLKDFAGKNIILNVFVSLDTPVCAASIRKFNQEAAKLANTVIICASMDLPFAHQRFCSTENIDKVIPASNFRNPEFGKAYGLTIIDGPLAQLLSRAIIAIDKDQKVVYTEQVAEITHEPNYQAVLDVVGKLI